MRRAMTRAMTLTAAVAALAMAAAPIAASAESLRYGGRAAVGMPSGGYHYGPPRGYYRPGFAPGRYYQPGGHYYGYGYGYPRYNNSGAAVAAGIAGLAVGTIIGSAAARQTGSSDWYRYCASKYRSFDPASGTYLGYDGRRHACR